MPRERKKELQKDPEEPFFISEKDKQLLKETIEALRVKDRKSTENHTKFLINNPDKGR